MKDLPDILLCLEKTPAIFIHLTSSIPEQMRKQARIPAAWTLHDHVCHLVQVQPMLIDRFRMFKEVPHPVIRPFLPGNSGPDKGLSAMDWDETVAAFPGLRQQMLDLIRPFDDALWEKEGTHPEYSLYTPYVLARHILMHDHWHMYRIEELWLTTDAYLTS